MSRHSRTSAASTVLKLCRNTDSLNTRETLDFIHDQIMASQNIPDESKDHILDLVTIVMFRSEQYRKAICELESALRSFEPSEMTASKQ